MLKQINLDPNKKVYFASDFHLGAPNLVESHERERKLVKWLDFISADAQTIFLVGDLFDFWHEYRRVVPRGFIRLLGKLAELSDAGIEIIVFAGNHDLWMSDYFETELNIKVHRKPLNCVINNKNNAISPFGGQGANLYLVHGDGYGNGDYFYKALRILLFENPIVTWAFKNLLHPDWALWLGQTWARHSWQKHEKEGQSSFWGEEKEWLIQHAKQVEANNHHDFYIFGHRHIVLDHHIAPKSRILILGDWVSHFSYAVFNGETMEMKQFDLTCHSERSEES